MPYNIIIQYNFFNSTKYLLYGTKWVLGGHGVERDAGADVKRQRDTRGRRRTPATHIVSHICGSLGAHPCTGCSSEPRAVKRAPWRDSCSTCGVAASQSVANWQLPPTIDLAADIIHAHTHHTCTQLNCQPTSYMHSHITLLARMHELI